MQVNLHDAKTLLSRYVEQALDGDEVVPVSTTPHAHAELPTARSSCSYCR